MGRFLKLTLQTCGKEQGERAPNGMSGIINYFKGKPLILLIQHRSSFISTLQNRKGLEVSEYEYVNQIIIASCSYTNGIWHS